MDKHKLLIAGGAVLLSLLLAAGAFLMSSPKDGQLEEQIPQGETHKVVFTEEGFDPKEITIKKGDVVEFSSAREFPFWPASDEHPTHAIYRAFDPLQPVPANETWSFQFTRVGTWDYHDHLNSTYKGKITVTE